MKRSWFVKVVRQLPENFPLLLYNLFGSVRVCTDDGKVYNIGWVDLLVFGSDEEGGYSNELQR